MKREEEDRGAGSAPSERGNALFEVKQDDDVKPDDVEQEADKQEEEH